jgi:hypothetical protein
MASRLYPGFGSGKGTYTADFECRSYAAQGKPDMELGDKIILPASALKDILKLKLSLPLQFRVTSDKACVGCGARAHARARASGAAGPPNLTVCARHDSPTTHTCTPAPAARALPRPLRRCLA